jgi:pimeloyl-ACP methyl ester carboxylesterase
MKHSARRALAATLALVAAAATALAATPPSAGGAPDTVVEGHYDVGGHRLFLTCSGTGSPTVVYMHGAIWDAHTVPHTNALAIRDRLDEDLRVCLYDRRNVGLSETVDEIQQPKDALRDLERLLDAADLEPPYVLLGASFGGLLSYSYANEHPDKVAGMVLLDSLFPDELEFERYFPRADRYRSFHREDICCTQERISHWKTMKKASRFIGREPSIPVVYLASAQEPWGGQGIPEYDDNILATLGDYVARFSPGELRWVDAPHFMEPTVPDEIASAVLDVAARASR